MNYQDFVKVFDEQLKLCRKVLITKSAEYSTEDKLHNFKIAGPLQSCTSEQALGGMLAKHVVSIFDMIRKGSDFPMEVWDEKLTDAINYLILLKALVVERQTKPE